MPPSRPFDLDLSLVLLSEGGKVDDRLDPGGRTNEGITQRVYDGYRDRKGTVRRDVYLITKAEVREIYYDQYALPLRVDEMPAGVGYAVFDAGVNSGVSRSAKWLQAALKVRADGHIGLATLAALRDAKDPNAIIDAVLNARLGFMRHLPTWLHFRKGWSKRVTFVRHHAHLMQRAPVLTTVAPHPAAAHA